MEFQDQPIENFKVISTGYKPPVNQDVRWMFDYNFLLVTIRAKLYGGLTEQDKNTGEVLIRYNKDSMLMNEIGIDKTMSLINGYISILHGLSQIEEDRIMLLCRRLAIQLDFWFYNNADDFDIEPSSIAVVVDMIMDLYELNLRRSLAGKTLNLIGTTEHYEHTQNMEKEKSGGWSLPFLPK